MGIQHLAYADDQAAMTNSIADMKVQAQKVQAFVAWSGITVSCKRCDITGMLYGQARRDGSSSVLSKSVINMVKDRVRQIKIHRSEIPFYHPHTNSYKYLGVNITPTFNWAPHLDRILTETKQKAERLINCALSKAQKMRILCTAIDPSITHSFAIGCLTELDISKFDAIRTRTCKGINGLPVSTSSAMVHQDTDQAGPGLPSLMVTYAEVSCRYLVQALNDIGSLGLVTRHLLLLQDKAIGVALPQPNNKQSLRQTSRYYLACQLATMQRSGLQLTFPQGQVSLRGNALSETLSIIHYDPQDLGLDCKIPVEVFRPLMDIVANITELCGCSAHRHVMLSTDELKLKYGNIVKKEHKVALNQLTKTLT